MSSGGVRGGIFSRGARQALELLRRSNHGAIFNPREIRSLLAELSGENSLVSVTLPGDGTEFTSNLFRDDTLRDGVWLDALSPASHGLAPAIGDGLKVRARADERALGFSSRVAEIGLRNKIPCYRLSWPRFVTQAPVRRHPRIGAPEGVKVYLLDASATVIFAMLKDISLGGIAARVMQPKEVDMTRGDTLPSCTIRLTDHQAFHGKLEVRHVRRDDEAEALTFGGQFVGLTHQHRAILERFIGEYQTAR